jgi:hypothetical protein
MPSRKKPKRKSSPKKSTKIVPSKLWNIGWSAMVVDGVAPVLMGEIVLLAGTSAAASKLASDWLNTKQPWNIFNHLVGVVQGLKLNKPKQVLEFYCYGDQSNQMPRLWQIPQQYLNPFTGG